MSIIDDRPSVIERYSSATESSNLKVSTERRGDADMLIAAGWCSETLGATLARLRTEFDAVKAQTKGQGNCSDTDLLLALIELKSLPKARQELGALAVARSARVGYAAESATVLKLAGQVLSAFLDPNCGSCDGRGFSGGGRHEHTGPQMICRRCGGSTKRRTTLGRNDAERGFATGLLSDIEDKASQFEAQMKRRMREEA